MLAELLRRLLSQFRLIFNLLSKPDTQFENPLSLLGLVESATTIADRVSGKTVISPKKKKTIKLLNCEMALHHKRALQRLLDEGDIDEAEFDALWEKTLDRVKAGV